MKPSLFWIISLLLLIFSSANADAEDKAQAPRRVASLTAIATPVTVAEGKAETPKKSRSLELRLSAAGGYFAGTQGAGDFDPTHDKGISLLAAADLRAFRYFGAEIEGSTGLKSQQSTSAGDEEAFTQQISRTLSTALFNLKVQLPVRVGGTILTPKIGAGYGVSSVTEEFSFSGGDVTSSSTSRISAAYAIAGLEFRPATHWIFGLDYARSVGGSVKESTSSSESEFGHAGPSFHRIRVMGAYRLNRNWSLGIEYAQRRHQYFFGGLDGNQITVTQDQFLGLLQLDL